MSGEPLQLHAIVLGVTPSGENFQRVRLFCPTHGGQFALRRISQKLHASIDLFDEIETTLTTKSGSNTCFIETTNLIRRRSGLAKRYKCFKAACDFARILDQNLPHTDQFEDLFQLTQEALNAWEQHDYAETIYLKTLYRYAREEGYPVKEDWLTNLPTDKRDEAHVLLFEPLSQINLPDDHTTPLLQQLTRWLLGNTDLLLSEHRAL